MSCTNVMCICYKYEFNNESIIYTQDNLNYYWTLNWGSSQSKPDLMGLEMSGHFPDISSDGQSQSVSIQYRPARLRQILPPGLQWKWVTCNWVREARLEQGGPQENTNCSASICLGCVWYLVSSKLMSQLNTVIFPSKYPPVFFLTTHRPS